MADTVFEGYCLSELLARMGEGQRLPVSAVWAVGKAVAHALSENHARADEEGNPQPVLHLLLSPDSVWIGPAGEVRLLDPGESASSAFQSEFDAPEQKLGQRLTPRTDTYRAGRLLIYLLSGDLFEGLSADAVRVLEECVIADSKRRKITCEELEQWCRHFDPNENGEKALADLIQIYKKPIQPDVIPEPPPEAKPEENASKQKPPLRILSNDPAIQQPARLSTAAALLVALVTAALVYGAGLLLAGRWQKRSPNPAKTPAHAILAP